MKNTARQKYKIHQGKKQNTYKTQADSHNKRNNFHASQPQFGFCMFCNYFPPLWQIIAQLVWNWTPKALLGETGKVRKVRGWNSTKTAWVLFCIVCNMNESRNIALACCPVPRLMCAQSTLGTPRHMEDNFGLDFLRRNFHISCFDFSAYFKLRLAP